MKNTEEHEIFVTYTCIIYQRRHLVSLQKTVIRHWKSFVLDNYRCYRGVETGKLVTDQIL